ncbi:hypothetical protein FQN55_007827 [Onygenales sp. PD_40]|nr:hypothetical protein FQN55_007827 [Onygenales sp. PD_40]KAK2795642.1 hypothetical protein FQN51_000399 [Onygenales sp. PD_10]
MTIFLLLPLFIHTVRIYAQESVSIDQQQGYGNLRECAEDCFASGISPAWAISKELSCDPHDPVNKCFCRADLQPQAERYVSSCVSSACSNTIDVSSAVSVYTAYCASAGYTRPKETQVSTTTGAFTVTVALATVTVERTVAPGAALHLAPVLSIPGYLAICILLAPMLGAALFTRYHLDSNPPSNTDVPNATETASPNSPSNPSDSSPSRTDQGGQQETQTPPATPADDDKDSGGKKLGAGEIVGIVVGVCSLLVAVITLIINWKTLKTSLANRRNKQSSVPVAYPVQVYPVEQDRRW